MKNIKLQGYEKFYQLSHEIDVLFDKNEMLGDYKFDINKLKKEFEKIYNLVDKKTKSNGFITEPNKGIKIDSQSYDLNSLNKKIESIIRNLNDMINPLYSVYVLMISVDKITNIKKEKYLPKLTELSKLLIYYIDNLEIQNTDNIKSLIDDACDSLYDALLIENACDKTEILDYLNSRDLSVSKDNVTSIFRNELLDNKIIPYSFNIKLEPELLKKVNDIEVIKGYSEKEKALNQQIENEKNDIKEYDEEIESMNKNKSKYFVTYLLYHSIPILATAVGFGLGLGIEKIVRNAWDKSPVRITRNLNTDEVISRYTALKNLPESYNKVFVVTTPWTWSDEYESYKRTISTYEINYDGKSSDLTEEELNRMFNTKEEKTEYKRNLDPTDEIKETTIIVDEYTYRTDEEFSIFMKCVKYIVALTAGIGSYFLIQDDFDDLKYVKIKDEIKKYKKFKIQSIENIKEYEKELQCQILEEEEIDGYSEIELSELLENKNTMVRVLSR